MCYKKGGGVQDKMKMYYNGIVSHAYINVINKFTCSFVLKFIKKIT